MFCKSALGWIDCVLYVCIEGVNYSTGSYAVAFFKLTIDLMGEIGVCVISLQFSELQVHYSYFVCPYVSSLYGVTIILKYVSLFLYIVVFDYFPILMNCFSVFYDYIHQFLREQEFPLFVLQFIFYFFIKFDLPLSHIFLLQIFKIYLLLHVHGSVAVVFVVMQR
jgi:hypothetical protein